MKKIIFTMVMSICMVAAYAQVKVYSSGKSVLGVNTGITTPLGQIHVVRALNEANQAIYADGPASAIDFTSTYSSLYLSNSNQTNNNYSRMNFGDGDAGATASVASRIENHAGNGGSLEFWTRPNAGSITQRMTVTSGGNIGIGTASPTNLLSVNGTANKTGGGSWAVFSDETMKKDISEYKDGLAEIMKINPITFRYNGKGGIQDTETEYVGILAQDMQEVAPYTVKNISMEVMDLKEVANKTDRSIESDRGTLRTENYLQFDPNALTYMLINSVKEQQKIIEEKEGRILVLEEKFAEMEARMDGIISGSAANVIKNQSQVTLVGRDLASVEQNVPNPFNGFTSIDYVVPASATSAQINIFNINGKMIKTVSIDHIGEGRLTVNVEDLPPGTYSYQLVVDNAPVATKKMVLAN
ncbi:MAG: tail fiber domain-containing protein [Saprospiraceae bacterium]|nr:tail fiber domain-containing protein [Saprospiraceae bacterium]